MPRWPAAIDDCHVRAYPPEIFYRLGDVDNVIGTGRFPDGTGSSSAK